MVDGPEFHGHAVNFTELTDRLTTYRSFQKEALDRQVADQQGACATTEVKA